MPATLQFLIAMIAYAINERMQRKLDYTQEEVRVLKDILVALTGSQRISFTADQRRRLAVVGKALSPEERKFSKAFIAILKAGGVRSVKIPAQSPNCNSCAERFVKTIKYECLNHFVIFGERHLRHLIKEFVEHYMTERFHQGIGGQLIRNVGPTNDNGADGKVTCRSRLGGLLNYYHRKAA
jgi:putative transposase